MIVGKSECLDKAVDKLSCADQMEDLPERVSEITKMLSSLELLLMPLLLPAASRGVDPARDELAGCSPVRELLIRTRKDMDLNIVLIKDLTDRIDV